MNPKKALILNQVKRNLKFGTDYTDCTEPVLCFTRHSPTWMTREKESASSHQPKATKTQGHETVFIRVIRA